MIESSLSAFSNPNRDESANVDPKAGIDEQGAVTASRLTYLYLSVITFMTLGMGDIRPLKPAAETLVTIVVVCGYVIFGVLISILANKIARRA